MEDSVVPFRGFEFGSLTFSLALLHNPVNALRESLACICVSSNGIFSCRCHGIVGFSHFPSASALFPASYAT